MSKADDVSNIDPLRSEIVAFWSVLFRLDESRRSASTGSSVRGDRSEDGFSIVDIDGRLSVGMEFFFPDDTREKKAFDSFSPSLFSDFWEQTNIRN